MTCSTARSAASKAYSGFAGVLRSPAVQRNWDQYGVARVEEADQEFRILVVVPMPTTQHVLCSVSALMVCIAALFGAEYDGWGCTIQRRSM
jgi:hypothetical protein